MASAKPDYAAIERERVKAVKDARRARPPKEAIKVVHARRDKEAFAAVDAAIAMINVKKKKKQALKAAKKAKKKAATTTIATSDDDNSDDNGSDRNSDDNDSDHDDDKDNDSDDEPARPAAAKKPAKNAAKQPKRRSDTDDDDDDNSDDEKKQKKATKSRDNDSDNDDNDDVDEMALAEEEEAADRSNDSSSSSSSPSAASSLPPPVDDEPKFSNDNDAITWWLRNKNVTITRINDNTGTASAATSTSTGTPTPSAAAASSVTESKAMTLAYQYPPVRVFTDLTTRCHVDDTIMTAISRGLHRPTPIQSSCWPLGIAGMDVVGIASTGSGKTLAFLVPAFHLIAQRAKTATSLSTPSASSSPAIATSSSSSSTTENSSTVSTVAPTSLSSTSSTLTADLLRVADNERGVGPLGLVLAPTRELALQIMEVARTTGGSCGIRTVCILGGGKIDEQRQQLASVVHIVIATPGRLITLVQEGACALTRVSYLVLDEADRMLDLGFEEDVKSITDAVPADRQTMLFSATWPKSIQDMSRTFLRANAAHVNIGSSQLSAAHSVKQVVEFVQKAGGHRERRLIELLKQYAPSKDNLILVFALYKREAEHVADYISRHGLPGWKSQALHGDMSQLKRNTAFAKFKSGEAPILVATDVAARGLDVQNIGVVINFSLGLSIEHYVHRIGRTGRAGRTGIAHTIFTDYDRPHASGLVALLREANQVIPPSILEHVGTPFKMKGKNHRTGGDPSKHGDAAYRHDDNNDDDDDPDNVLGDWGKTIVQARKKQHPGVHNGRQQAAGRGRGRGRGGGKGRK